MSQYTQNKAIRLVAEGRVQPDSDLQPQLFRVDGDSDRYVTVVAAHVHMCSCKRWRETMLDCSHIKAALLRVYARPDELALMDEALQVRRDREHATDEAAVDAL